MTREINAYKFDAIVIGSGIQGLLLAKRLLDLGQSVALIEKSSTLAKGATSKNHGWLHQGTTHSLSAKDVAHGKRMAKQLQYGHAFFKSYAPECFDEPLQSTYAVTNSTERADYARKRWADCGVPFKELTAKEYFALEPEINRHALSYFFEVSDSRLNNRLLLMKLYAEIKAKGALILTSAEYEYESGNKILILSESGTYLLESPLFFYATGAGLDDCYRKLTNESLGLQYFKSQMLFMPKVSRNSLIQIDYSSPIVVNHGDLSVVNRSHDDVATINTDYEVNSLEVKRALASVYALSPKAKTIPASKIIAIACLKPSLPSGSAEQSLSVDSYMSEPRKGHFFVLPGKMTSAPYVTDELIKKVAPYLNLSMVTPRPHELPLSPLRAISSTNANKLSRIRATLIASSIK
jgi:glycerol-3-phosphate dehydrogenase